MSNNSKIVLGIDVAKLKLDVALILSKKTLTKQFANSAAGFNSLSCWLKSLDVGQVHACLESTGSYSQAAAHFLHAGGHIVSIVNPSRVTGFAKSKMQRNKTDTADARLIAEFCLSQNPAQWFPPAPAVAELQAMTRRIETLAEMLQMERNRFDTAAEKTKPSITRMSKTFEQEIDHLRKSIKEHIDRNPDLKSQEQLLETIPGIGQRTAQLLLAEIEFARYDSARAVAAYAGVTPKKKQSGTSLNRTNLSKMGNKRIRKGLYFPAIVATTHNQIVKEFASRLEKNGKTPMQIVCASIRKLLHIAFGVLKHKTPFDPSLAFSG